MYQRKMFTFESKSCDKVTISRNMQHAVLIDADLAAADRFGQPLNYSSAGARRYVSAKNGIGSLSNSS